MSVSASLLALHSPSSQAKNYRTRNALTPVDRAKGRSAREISFTSPIVGDVCGNLLADGV